MKRNMFQNKYTNSNLLKIFFADIVCFLVVAICSVGFCYSYFNDKADASGTAGMAKVTIDYRKVAGDEDTSIDVVYGSINGGSLVDLTSSVFISPGDVLNIRGYAVNTSNVAVYVLAKLEITVDDGTQETTEAKWFNISNNLELTEDATGLYEVGASSLDIAGTGTTYYQAISLTYTFEGAKYTNEHEIKGVKLTLHAHQKEYLELASDYSKYSKFDDDKDGYISGYTIQSLYAAHYITGELL